MKKYVLGFAFKGKHVLLIRKKRPRWQAGLLNGIGGHREISKPLGSLSLYKTTIVEDPMSAMIREFEEETGLVTTDSQWKEFGRMEGPDWDCYLYSSFTIDIDKAESKTDEMVGIVDIDRLGSVETVGNLQWLIHMALDDCSQASDGAFYVNIRYS